MENYTPFPNLRFFNTDAQGREFGVLLVKGTYIIEADGSLALTDDQEPLVLTDTYHGALNTSSLWMPSDLVPRKPRADIIVNAVARAPHGQPAGSWLCSVRVDGRHTLEKRLRVTGPRAWEPAWAMPEKVRALVDETTRRRSFRGWRLSEPEPVAEVAIRYELAYGGVQERPQKGSEPPLVEADERNPIGRGWIDPQTAPPEAAVPAPQIEAVAEPIVDPHHRYTPEGFGPIPPAWLPRRPLGGTYDDHWQANVWPNWPADYDFAFHNSAHPGLVYPDFLIGDETVTLTGLDPQAHERIVRLPRQTVVALIERKAGDPISTMMHLDTLLLDIAEADRDEHRVFLSWRVAYDPADALGVTFVLVDLPDASAGWERPRSQEAA